MAVLLNSTFYKALKINQQLCNKFHINSVVYLDQKWRKQNKLPKNPNSFGPLTNLPDYSFKDGRPVPYGSNQKKRIDQQLKYYMKIKELVGEIDYAVERYDKLQKEAEMEKRQIIDSKLKEKGAKLLTAKSET